MNKLLVLLAVILLASTRRIHKDYPEFSHYSTQERQYPNHYYDSDYGHYDNEGYQHEESEPAPAEPTSTGAAGASGSAALFDALKADTSVASLLNNPKASDADYEKVKSSIVNILKGNNQIQSKLADEMFGNGNIGALFDNEQRVKLLNFVMDNPDIIKSGKQQARAQVINFIKNDPELSSVYNANKATFGG